MKSVLLIFLLLVSLIATSQSLFRLESPGGNITVQISIKDTLKYSVSIENSPVISNAHAAMKLSAGEWLGIDNKLKRIS